MTHAAFLSHRIRITGVAEEEEEEGGQQEVSSSAYDPFNDPDVYDSKEFLSGGPVIASTPRDEMLDEQHDSPQVVDEGFVEDGPEVTADTVVTEDVKATDKDEVADSPFVQDKTPMLLVNVENIVDKQYTQDQELKVWNSVLFFLFFC